MNEELHTRVERAEQKAERFETALRQIASGTVFDQGSIRAYAQGVLRKTRAEEIAEQEGA